MESYQQKTKGPEDDANIAFLPHCCHQSEV
jgi:hypothetical protein